VLLADHVDSLEMGQLFMNQSWVLNRSRQFAPAMEKANAALEIFKAHNSRENIALVYNNLAVFCEHQDDFDKALEYNQLSLQLFTDLNDKRQMANLYLSLGYVHNSRKEFEPALEYFSKSVTLMERIGNRYGAGTALMSKGRIYMDTNRLDLAARELNHSLRIHQDLDLKKKIVANELALTKLHMMKQEWTPARQHLAVAHAEAEALNYESDLAKIFLLDAQLLVATAQDPQAAYTRAIELFRKLNRNRDADQASGELAAWKSR
jgi:tetratricopeptide (TPR) repeat protein